jgi:hypothetical protein
MGIKLNQQSDPTIASVVYTFNLVKQFEELVRKSPTQTTTRGVRGKGGQPPIINV